jgi:hypothetical protein
VVGGWGEKGYTNGIADDIVIAINNSIASSKGNSPVHVEVNDLAKAIDKDRVNRIVRLYPL